MPSKQKRCRRISRKHRWLSVKVVATTVDAVALTFGVLFILISTFARNITSTSKLDTWGTVLIVSGLLLGFLQITYGKKK